MGKKRLLGLIDKHTVVLDVLVRRSELYCLEEYLKGWFKGPLGVQDPFKGSTRFYFLITYLCEAIFLFIYFDHHNIA